MDSYWEGYSDQKPTVILQNWSMTMGKVDPYTAPELIPSYLCGEVYGHSNFEDGERITTSRVIDSSGSMVETRNTFYDLKEPDVSYGLWCEEHGYSLDPSSFIKMK
jgi:hypothetical protein